MTKFPHADRTYIDKDDNYIMGATRLSQSLCPKCNNIHLTLYNDNNEPFANATVSPEQVDDFVQKMKLLRNDALRRTHSPDQEPIPENIEAMWLGD